MIQQPDSFRDCPCNFDGTLVAVLIIVFSCIFERACMHAFIMHMLVPVHAHICTFTWVTLSPLLHVRMHRQWDDFSDEILETHHCWSSSCSRSTGDRHCCSWYWFLSNQFSAVQDANIRGNNEHRFYHLCLKKKVNFYLASSPCS